MKDPYERNMFAASTAEMVVSATPANRVLLIGKIDKDRRLPGMLDQLHINTDDVINIAADTMYKKGVLEDAVTMYDLAGNHEKVLSIMCMLLAQVVSQKGEANSLRSRLHETATDMSIRYGENDILFKFYFKKNKQTKQKTFNNNYKYLGTKECQFKPHRNW